MKLAIGALIRLVSKMKSRKEIGDNNAAKSKVFADIPLSGLTLISLLPTSTAGVKMSTKIADMLEIRVHNLPCAVTRKIYAEKSLQ
jgi:hypothetical protein